MHALEPVSKAIQTQKEIAPGKYLLVPTQVHTREIFSTDEELIDSHFIRNLLERLFGVSDRKRHQDGARPRRDFVDVEPEPLGKQYDLGRNCGNGIVIILAEKAEINLGKSVDLGYAAQFQDLLPRSLQRRIIRVIPDQLQREIRLY